jgi:hypothetical protein
MRGNLVGFSNNDPQSHDNAVCRIRLTILDQREANSSITDLSQTKDGNLDHMTRSEDRWERSTQKVCSHRRRNHICIRTMDQCQQARSWGGLSMIVIKQGQSYTSEASGQWRGSALPTRPGDDNPDIDVKSDLTTSSSQKIQNWCCCSWILTKSRIVKI